MKPFPAPGLGLFFMAFFAVTQPVFGGAQVVAHIPHPTNPNLGLAQPVVEVRGNKPYVEVDHELHAVRSASLEIFVGGAPSAPVPPPRWLIASNIQTEFRKMEAASSADRGINKELVFSLDLESPVPVDHVWIALGVHTEKVGDGIIVQEIGALQAYSPTNVVIHRRLSAELGEIHCFWHVFVRDRELLTSQMDREHVEADMNYGIGVALNKIQHAEAQPYLVFPPRNISGAAKPISLEGEIRENGELRRVSVLGEVDSKLKRELLKAVEHWWFLPRVEQGIKVPMKVTLDVDLSDADHWSNDRVRISPRSP